MATYKTVMTADQFDKYLNEFIGKTKYVKGCYGQVLTKSLLDSKYKQSGLKEWFDKPCVQDESKSNYEYLVQFTQGNEAGKWFAADCVCLQKGILWGYRATPYPGGTVGKYKSNNVPDATTADWYNKYCTDKTDITNKTSLPSNAEKGMIMYMPGHIGAIDDPKAINCLIESTMRNDGVSKKTPLKFQSKYYNGQVVPAWTGMGKSVFIDYTKKSAADPAPTTSNTSSSSSSSSAAAPLNTTIGTGVAKHNMNVRDKGSLDGKVIGNILTNQMIEVRKQLSNGWYEITWPAAKCGYAYTSNVSNQHYTFKSNANETAYKVKTTCVLNVRKGPGTNYPVVTTLQPSTSCKIIETNNKWGKIKDGQWICVSSSYVTKV